MSKPADIIRETPDQEEARLALISAVHEDKVAARVEELVEDGVEDDLTGALSALLSSGTFYETEADRIKAVTTYMLNFMASREINFY